VLSDVVDGLAEMNPSSRGIGWRFLEPVPACFDKGCAFAILRRVFSSNRTHDAIQTHTQSASAIGRKVAAAVIRENPDPFCLAVQLI
jgi:hypothetical protein